MRYGTIAIALASLVLGACGKGDEDGGHGGHGDHEHGGGGNITVPDHYAEAVAKCEEISKKIGKLIADGDLADVHAAAADIKKIAEKLPKIAKRDLPASMLRDVNVKSKELAGMFSEIDKAADAGKKAETVKLHARMKELVAGLVAHAAHVKEEDHDDHAKEEHHEDHK